MFCQGAAVQKIGTQFREATLMMHSMVIPPVPHLLNKAVRGQGYGEGHNRMPFPSHYRLAGGGLG